MKMTWKFLLTLMAAVALTACSSGAPSYSELPGSSVAASGNLPTGTSGSDRIAPQDLLEIEVFKVPDLSKEVRVDDGGNITLALIGTVHAEGMSASQLEKQIASRLEKDYMHNPQVNVLVKESAGSKITVSGSVRKPGVYPLAGDTTVTQAIALAEGMDRLATKDTITLFRNGKPYSVPYDAITKGQVPDPVVMAGDKIQVHTSGVRDSMDTVRGFIAPFTFF